MWKYLWKIPRNSNSCLAIKYRKMNNSKRRWIRYWTNINLRNCFHPRPRQIWKYLICTALHNNCTIVLHLLLPNNCRRMTKGRSGIKLWSGVKVMLVDVAILNKSWLNPVAHSPVELLNFYKPALLGEPWLLRVHPCGPEFLLCSVFSVNEDEWSS